MASKNAEVVKEFVAVGNSGRLDRFKELCTPDCLVRGPSYVGTGFNGDDSDGKRVMVNSALKGGPSEGRLLPGDEILSVREGGRLHEGYEALHQGIWGQGVPGTTVDFHLRRAGKEVDVTVIRGRIPGYELPLSEAMDSFASFFRDWPDHHEELELVVDGGEYVATVSTVTGTNAEFGRAATWPSYNIYRLKDGRICELRGLDDLFAQCKQLGYTISPPGKG